jgi:hypothetical protein
LKNKRQFVRHFFGENILESKHPSLVSFMLPKVFQIGSRIEARSIDFYGSRIEARSIDFYGSVSLQSDTEMQNWKILPFVVLK